QAVDLGAVAIDRGDCLVEADILTGTGHVGGVDEVVNILVEHEGRDRTGTAHVVLDTQVEVAGFQRFEVGITEFGLVVIQHKAGEHLAKGRAHHAVGPGGADLRAVVELVDGMQTGQPVVVLVIGVIGNKFALIQTGTAGLDARAFVTQAGDDAQVVDIHSVHHIGGVDVLFDGEVVDARLLLIVEVRPIQTADQVLHRAVGNARAEAAQTVVGAAPAELRQVQLLIGKAQLVEVLVDPDVQIVVLLPATELAAESQLRGQAAQVEVPGQVELDVFLGVGGALFFPFHFGQAEVAGVVQFLPGAQARLAGAVVADVTEIIVSLEGGVADAARAVLAGLAVTGLGADTPVAELALAAKHEAFHFLGFFPGLELTDGFSTCQLRIAELGDQRLAHFIILETAVQAAEPDLAVLIGAVIQVQAKAGTL